MIISDVIQNAKNRFSLLLTEETEINAFLVQALTCYQDLAGCIRSQVVTSPSNDPVLLPESCLSVCMVKDKHNDYVPFRQFDNDDGEQFVILDESATYPVVVDYFVYLAGYANKPNAHIPNQIAGMITDYLSVLISIDNDDRVAKAENAGKMDASRTPTTQDHVALKTALEDQFRANRAIIPMFSIMPR